MIQLIEDTELLETLLNKVSEKEEIPESLYITDEWTEVEEDNVTYNYEMLYAFHNPLMSNFPTIRVARITKDNHFLVCTATHDETDLGDYRKLRQPIFVQALPILPECMWPVIF